MQNSASSIRRNYELGSSATSQSFKPAKEGVEDLMHYHIGNVNQALKVTTLMAQLTSMYEINNALCGTNIGLNYKHSADNDERDFKSSTSNRKSKPVDTNELHGKLLVNHLLDKGYNLSRNIDLLDDSDRPETVHMRRSEPKLVSEKLTSAINPAKKSKTARQVYEDEPIRKSNRLLSEVQEVDSPAEQTRKNADAMPYVDYDNIPLVTSEHNMKSLRTSNPNYIITEKTTSDRYWQQKFEERPETPVKVVTFIKPGQTPENVMQSPIEGTNKLVFAQSQGLTINTNRIQAPREYNQPQTARERPHEQELFSSGKPLPFFQYSANRFRNSRSGERERERSPVLSSSVKEMNLKQMIDSQLIKLTKGTTSTKLTGQSSYHSPQKNFTSPTVEDELVEPFTAETNDSNGSPRGTLTSPGSSRKIVKEEPKKKPLKYVVVDANKRYSMPISSKTSKLKVSYKREAESTQSSIRKLNYML